MEDERKLVVGANQIARIVNRSLREIVNLKLYENLPMFLVQGIWKAYADDLERWRVNRDNGGGIFEWEEPSEAPEKTEKERKEEINKKLEELGAKTLTYNNGLKKFEKALEEALGE